MEDTIREVENPKQVLLEPQVWGGLTEDLVLPR